MNLPRLNSLIVFIFALLYPTCAQELEPNRSFKITFYSEINQQGQIIGDISSDYFVNDYPACYIWITDVYDAKSLSLRSNENCMLLYRNGECSRHVFRVIPGAAINNDLTSVNFTFDSLSHCWFPNNSGLLFYKKPDSPAFYNTSAIETYTGCQNLPDFVRNEDIEAVQLLGVCANLFRDENCRGEVFYLRPINAGRSPPAIYEGEYGGWYDYFTLKSRVASFSPCGANWTTSVTGTAVTGSTDGPDVTTEETTSLQPSLTTEETTSLQPSLHSCTPNIFAPMCILVYLITM